jgi:hypothetical protein
LIGEAKNGSAVGKGNDPTLEKCPDKRRKGFHMIMHIYASSVELKPPFACGEPPCHADETLSIVRSFWERYPAKWLMGCFMERYVPKIPRDCSSSPDFKVQASCVEKTALC